MTTPQPCTPDRRLAVTVPEAASLLGLGRESAYKAARAGELPVIRVGRRILVPLAALRKLLGEADPSTP